MSKKLEVINLNKTFNQGENAVHALTNVSFSVNSGEFVVITGYSGSGKSTLLNALGCLLTTDSGSILVDGKDICAMNEKQRNSYRCKDISIIFQSYNLLSDLTVYENVLLGRKLGDNRSCNVDEVLSVLNLEKRKDHYPSELSGGEQQRASIARALCKGGSIYLCDEPTGALDVENGIRVLQYLQDLAHNSNKTVIVITHNGLVSQAGDHNIVMRDGKIVEDSYNSSPLAVSKVNW